MSKLKRNFWAIVFFVLAAYLFLGMISCSPQRRLNRLISKHPELIQHDTTWINDTIITNHYHRDTILSIHHHWGDTVIIKDRKLTERIIYLPGDSIKVEGDCASDTIIKEVPIYINTVKTQLEKVGFFQNIWDKIKEKFPFLKNI